MLFQASTHSSLTFKEQNTFFIVFDVFSVHTTTGQACVNSRTDHRYHGLIHPGDDQTALHPQFPASCRTPSVVPAEFFHSYHQGGDIKAAPKQKLLCFSWLGA